MEGGARNLGGTKSPAASHQQSESTPTLTIQAASKAFARFRNGERRREPPKTARKRPRLPPAGCWSSFQSTFGQLQALLCAPRLLSK
eukprot:14301316-Alexandrium_andersonii.AAC.1